MHGTILYIYCQYVLTDVLADVWVCGREGERHSVSVVFDLGQVGLVSGDSS